MKKISVLLLVLFLILCMSNFAEAADVAETPLYPAEIWTIDKLRSGYVDAYGRWVIQPDYNGPYFEGQPIPNTSNGYLYPVMQGEKQGFMNREGKWIISPKYDLFPNGTFFSEDKLAVRENGHIYVIDCYGKTLFALKDGQHIGIFSEGLAWSYHESEPSKLYYVNEKNAPILGPFTVDPESSYFYNFHDGLAKLSSNKKWGFINKQGKWDIPPQYEEVSSFSEGFACVEINEKWGFLDTKGKLVIPARYEDVRSFSEGCAGVREQGKWKFIDSRGVQVIPGEFEEYPDFSNIYKGYTFHNGVANVPSNDKWGCIDKTGKWVVEAQFNTISPFVNDVAYVETGKNRGYFNKEYHYWICQWPSPKTFPTTP